MVRLNSFNNGLFDFSVYTLMSAPGKETWFIGGPNLQWYIYIIIIKTLLTCRSSSVAEGNIPLLIGDT